MARATEEKQPLWELPEEVTLHQPRRREVRVLQAGEAHGQRPTSWPQLGWEAWPERGPEAEGSWKGAGSHGSHRIGRADVLQWAGSVPDAFLRHCPLKQARACLQFGCPVATHPLRTASKCPLPPSGCVSPVQVSGTPQLKTKMSDPRVQPRQGAGDGLRDLLRPSEPPIGPWWLVGARPGSSSGMPGREGQDWSGHSPLLQSYKGALTRVQLPVHQIFPGQDS